VILRLLTQHHGIVDRKEVYFPYRKFSLIRHHHPNLARKVDVIYALAQAWVSSGENSDFDMLEKYLSGLKPEESILVGVLRDLLSSE
jgi:hypothetical protein